MIRGVLFDMDGVLLDTERLGSQLLPKVLEEMGYSSPEGLYLRLLGVNQHLGGQIYREVFGDDFPQAEANRRFFQRLMEVAAAGALPPKPGLSRCMEGLRARGIPCALATSSERTVVELYQRAVPALQNCFDATICGVEVPNGKPAPDIYLLAAKKLKLAPSECLGVEDSRNGLKSLRAAGCYSLMIPDLLPFDESLAPYVDRVLDSLDEVCGLVDRLNG
ncbi:MAG: HAD family phosphatase [Eubacteriales bacterium]|nr:HAD family phosphatase [Eubacteriales bacterium]